MVAFRSIGEMWGDEIFELERLPELRYVTPGTREQWSARNNRYRAQGKDAEDLKRRHDGILISVGLQKQMLAAMQEAGVRLLLGTDSSRQMPFVVHGFASHEELALLVDSGLTPWQALRAGTANAAEFLGQTGEFGTIEVGARADLVLVEADPQEDVANLQRRVGVMMRGRWMPAAELRESLERLAASRAD
jgi:adenine deaminase